MAEHYYTQNPNSKKIIREFTASIGEIECTFVTASGLFSLDHLDIGSLVLISYCDISNVSTLLDLGCGYGAVGIFLKKMHPHLNITATDINERAIEYTKKNVVLNNVEIEAFQSDGFTNISQSFDCIVLNPPQSAGKKVCEALILDAKSHLNRGGSLQIVARAKKGGKALSEFMESVYGNVTVLKRKSGFSVYKSIK